MPSLQTIGTETLRIIPLRENTVRFTKIPVRENDTIHFLDPHDIIRCEADNNYTFLILSDSRKKLIAKCLKHFEATLPSSLFIRVHAKHLINIQCIRQINLKRQKSITMDNGDEVIISRSRYESVKIFLNL